MTERPTPYIGISGVIGTDQQYYLMDQFVWQGLDERPAFRQIALGVKAVHKTQFLDVENKYGPDWYPVGAQSFETALDGGGIQALRVAQVYLDSDFVGDPQYRDAFVARICKRGKAWLNALQFDMLPWHTDSTVLSFMERVKDETGFTILLQAHSDAMRYNAPNELVRKLAQYAHVADYVLFDASHGKGVQLDPQALRPYLGAAYESTALQSTGMALAGGLNARVVRDTLPEILQQFPDISWDAEGQLHPVQPDGTRPIDMHVAKQYLEASGDILRAL